MKAVCILGYSNSGKTTLIVELLTALRAAGLRAAAFKFSRHPGDFDRPGSDSARFAAAGAEMVGYRGGAGWFVQAPAEPVATGEAGPPPAAPSRTPEEIQLPPWILSATADLAVGIFEGAVVPGALRVMTGGDATTVPALKYDPQAVDLIVTDNPALRAQLVETPHRCCTVAEAAAVVMESLMSANPRTKLQSSGGTQ